MSISIIFTYNLSRMVLTVKIFVVDPALPLKEIEPRLRGYRQMRKEKILGREIEVGSRITELGMEGSALVGTFEENLIVSTTYEGEVFRVPLTVRTRFELDAPGEVTLLVVAARKARANRIAGQLSSLLSTEKRRVIAQEAWIPSDTLREFFEARMDTVRVVFFDNVRLPNVDKLSLYGSQLARTDLYREYVRLGRVWYVMFEPEDGMVVGLTRNCVVTFFSKLSMEDAMDFIRERVFPLVEVP